MRNTAVQKYGQRDCKTWCLRRGCRIQFFGSSVQFPKSCRFGSLDLMVFWGYSLILPVWIIQNSKKMLSYKRPLEIGELNANHCMVSVHKCGFFLCREGTARIILGSSTYRISRNYLCFYAPNTFFQILEKSADLTGILEEDDVEAYYPVHSSIDIRKRLQVRNSPCVKISEKQADEMMRFYNMLHENEEYLIANEGSHEEMRNEFTDRVRADCTRYLRYALCLKAFEAYFSNTPVKAMPQAKDDAILNRFLVSVYKNCHRQRTVQYYADEQHLSPYYFSSIIRARSGQSALQWIGNVTMTFSRQYLECSEMSIKEIADRMNFPDQSTFGRYFKHHEGCSPSEFRERRLRN